MAANGSIPGWITLGFLSGLVFAFVFTRTGPAPALLKPAVVPAGNTPVTGTGARQIPNLPLDASTLGEVEVLFQAWGGYALWKGGVTQFALWNKDTGAHTDFYEVRRVNRIYSFRTLPEKDWPLLDHGEMVRCPLWFAEPPDVREKFYREHPELTPTTPILRSLPPRAPLQPVVAPSPNELGVVPPPGSERTDPVPPGR